MSGIFTPCLVNINAYLSASFLVKQITIKENAFQHAVYFSDFLFFNCNSGYVRVQFPQSSFVQISGRNYYICQICKITLMRFHGNEVKTRVGNRKQISLTSHPSFFCFSIVYSKDALKSQLQLCMTIWKTF